MVEVWKNFEFKYIIFYCLNMVENEFIKKKSLKLKVVVNKKLSM